MSQHPHRRGPGRRGLLLLAVASTVLAAAPAASAASFTVNDFADAPLASASGTSCTSTDSGQCTLRAAVQAADNLGGPSTITLAAGTYTLSVPPAGGTNDPATGDLDIFNAVSTNTAPSVTITGAGSATTTIDANHIDRVFATGTGTSLSLSGLTLTNGAPTHTFSNDGGAIHATGALTLAGDVTVTASAGRNGGGIDVPGGSGNSNVGRLTVRDSNISGNTATSEGGGIHVNLYAPASVTGTTLSNNHSANGGGIYDGNSTNAHYDNNQINNNVATSNGGGLYLDANSGYTLNHDEVDGNSAASGGAIYSGYGTISADSSSFIGNTASRGGFMYENNGDPLILTNTTISKNSATTQGGAFYLTYNQPVDWVNDTITFNTSGSGAATTPSGGGIYGPSYLQANNIGIQNTIIAQNSGGDCTERPTGGSADAAAPVPTSVDAGHNIGSDGSCFTGTGAAGDQPAVDPLLAQPAANGSAVQTDAEQPGSPAIDGGSDTNCPVTDALGIARPQGAACDVGAREYNTGNGTLTLTKTAPQTATAGTPYAYSIAVGNSGPGRSTTTTLTDHLPAGLSVLAVDPSQGSCTRGGTPVIVTCSLGTLAAAAGAHVTVLVSAAGAGTVTNTATVTNDQGASASASSVTAVSAAAASGSSPSALTGPPSQRGLRTATLTGRVTVGHQQTAYFFEVGTSKRYGTLSALGYRTQDGTVSVRVTGLRPATRYHYRLLAINADGTSSGADQTFRTRGQRYNGSLVLMGQRLRVSRGAVFARFKCASTVACSGKFSIGTRAKVAKTQKIATVLCTQGSTTAFHIGAHRTQTVTGKVPAACLSLLNAAHGRLAAKLTSAPRSSQRAVIQHVTLFLG